MSANVSARKSLFRSRCEEHGVRITPQREVIFDALAAAGDHPSADVLYRRVRRVLPNISFDTVYRTLQTFADLGLVRPVEGYGELRRFDPETESHHHLRCLKCQKIVDFHNSDYDALAVPAACTRDFVVTNKRVVLEGVCRACQAK